MGPFTQILTGSELIAAFGDEHTAVLVYDTSTVPVPSAPAAECVTVTDGKISYSRFIFDLGAVRRGQERGDLSARPPNLALRRAGNGLSITVGCASSSAPWAGTGPWGDRAGQTARRRRVVRYRHRL